MSRFSETFRIRRVPGSAPEHLPRLVRRWHDAVAQGAGERAAVGPGNELDDESPVLHALDREVPGVDAELFADRLLDRGLPALSYYSRHFLLLPLIHTSRAQYVGVARRVK